MVKKGLYKHYKGGYYLVDAVGIHSETGEEVVIYHSEKDKSKVWVRPLSMFIEEVRAGIKRFEFIKE